MNHHGLKISSVVTGLLVIMAGVLLFLFNAEVLDPAYRPVIFSWQMLLVALGFNGLFSRSSWLFCLILMMVGGFFLLQKLDIEGLAFVTRNGWTILLVFAGLSILFHAIFKRNAFSCCSSKFEEKKGWNHCKNESGYVEFNYVFSGAREKLSMGVFRGGEINCVFGGIELDFYDCQLPEGVAHLELNTVFGGTVLYIPNEWNVEIRGDQVFGNFVDTRSKTGFEVDKSRTLIIKASSVFGGGEIKSKN